MSPLSIRSYVGASLGAIALIQSCSARADLTLGCNAICDRGVASVMCLIKIETTAYDLLQKASKRGLLLEGKPAELVGTTPSPELCDSVISQPEPYVVSKSVPVIGPVSGIIQGTSGLIKIGSVFTVLVKYGAGVQSPRILDPSIKTSIQP